MRWISDKLYLNTHRYRKRHFSTKQHFCQQSKYKNSISNLSLSFPICVLFLNRKFCFTKTHWCLQTKNKVEPWSLDYILQQQQPPKLIERLKNALVQWGTETDTSFNHRSTFSLSLKSIFPFQKYSRRYVRFRFAIKSTNSSHHYCTMILQWMSSAICACAVSTSSTLKLFLLQQWHMHACLMMMMMVTVICRKNHVSSQKKCINNSR